MLVFELRWLLFAVLALVALAVSVTALLSTRVDRRGTPAFSPIGDLMAALSSLPIGALAIDSAGVCRGANPAARRIFDLATPPARLPSGEWVDLLEADRRAMGERPRGVGRSRTVRLGQTGGHGGDSARVLRWWISPLGEYTLVLVMDVTAQHRAEDAARYLVNDISHELRTPLATILTHLEVLGLTSITPEIRQQSTALLKAEAQRMTRLIQQMLELGRLETSVEIERRPIDLAALVEGVAVQIQPAADRCGIGVTVETDSALPLVSGDRDRLRQVLLNLMDNAVKYCRPGDRVAVSVSRLRQGVACAVADTGPGIPKRHLPYVTRRFYRANSPEQDGSGLGLALAAEIVRRHGGVLEVDSRDEGEATGTTVRFVLPAADDASLDPGSGGTLP